MKKQKKPEISMPPADIIEKQLEHLDSMVRKNCKAFARSI